MHRLIDPKFPPVHPRAPHRSILNARFETPAPPLGALSPRALSAMRPGGPTGVKLCGAVRIRGDAITPLHTATPPAPIHAAAAPAAPGRTERIPTPPPPELAVAAIVSAATKRARLVAPPPAPKPAASGQCSANCAPAMPPLAASNRVATSPQRPPASPARPPRSALRAQMEMTPPRKRARKSAAPLRAAASSEEAVEGAGTPASLRKQGSFSGETDDSGDVPLAATPLLPAVPSKAMRCGQSAGVRLVCSGRPQCTGDGPRRRRLPERNPPCSSSLPAGASRALARLRSQPWPRPAHNEPNVP